MSKSYGNTIGIFDEGKPLRSAVMSIVTDSTPVEAPKEPESNTVYQLYRLFATAGESDEMAERFRAGGYGYGDAKKALLAKIDAFFEPFRVRRMELDADKGYVEDVLQTGARRAHEEARKVLNRARRACGID
jgi:tryptophanyl-tRNA synthetase